MKVKDITKDLYLCSPLLNKECSKTNCYINNGCCCHTVDKEYLFVSVIDHTSYGFVPNTIKEVGYITEKLGLHNDKLSELINGVISSLNNMGETNE